MKILHIHDDEDIWVFMDYCEGGDLNDYSKHHFDELQDGKIAIMSQMSKGLAFLHDCRISHRDIKPENVLIKPQSGSQLVTVKLTDFGLAKYLDPEDTTSAMETKLGTRLYMAPEFYNQDEKGEIKYHKDVDIFALGLTFVAIIDAKPGQNLKPIAAGCEHTEWAQPIGLAMLGRHTRGLPGLVIARENVQDTAEIRAVKEIIRRAIAFCPEDIPTARYIVKSIEKLLPPARKTLEVGGTSYKESIDEVKSPVRVECIF